MRTTMAVRGLGGLALLLGLLAGSVYAAEPVADIHRGVADCAGSTCHGSTRPFVGRPIRQDEYFTWLRRDRHGRAWHTLLSARSRAITAHLGWGAPEQAPGCLSCHGHTPPPDARGPRFLVEDGVGCEACHGAAERYLAPHTEGELSAERKRALGMTPTWDIAARAELCLSCHQGDAQRPMTHAIMAAGHPPLLFELDTFMSLMPPHHDVDADYIARKGAPDPAREWLVGQLTAADQYLEALARHPATGLFPELARYDCDACHHPMDAQRLRAGRTPGAPVGSVPLADQALVTTAAWLQALYPQQAARWRDARTALYSARDLPAQRAAATQALALLRDWRAQADAALSAREVRALLAAVLAPAGGAHAGDFRYAEQAAMAANVLGAALAARGEDSALLRAAIEALYDSVRTRGGFDAVRFAAASNRLRALVAG